MLRPSLLLLLGGFCILVLPVIVRKDILDFSLMPRMLALLVFLLVFSITLLSPSIYRKLDFSVLKHPLFPVYGLYFLVSFLSLVFALNVSAGLSDIYRTFAFLMLLVCICLVLEGMTDWHVRLPKLFILGGLLISLIGLHELIRELGFGFHSRNEISSIRGLMSNVNLYASSLMLTAPWTVYGLVSLRGGWRWLAGISTGLLLFMIFLLQTRAAYAGIIAAFLGGALVVLVFRESFSIGRITRNRIITGLLILITAFTALVLIAGEDNIYASRFRSIFSSAENQNRIMIWHVTARMIADQPITGVGAGNYTIRAQEYYDGYDFSVGPPNILRPHNDPLWVFAEKGIAGFLLFMAFFAIAFRDAWKIMGSQAGRERKFLALAVGAGLIGYFVNSLFDFPLERINHQVHLAFLVATILIIRQQANAAPTSAVPSAAGPPAWFRWFMLPVLLVLVSGIWYSLEAIRQEKHVARARTEELRQNWSGMLQAARLASTPWKTLDPLGTPVVYLEGRALYRLGNTSGAVQKLEEALVQNPNRRFILRTLALIHTSEGQFDKGIAYFQQALAFYPLDEDLLLNLGRVYIQLEDFPAALEVLERIPEEKQTGDIQAITGYVNQVLLQQRLRRPAQAEN